MKVKNKLRLGFGFLFVVVLVFGAVSLFYINEISNSAKVILKDNYESLEFTRDMRSVLDNNELPLSTQTSAQFNTPLTKEEHNITEVGELQAAKGLRGAFIQLQSKNNNADQLKLYERAARKYLRDIDVVNMKAIVLKNEKAHTAVENAIIFLGLAATFTFLVLFSFTLNFPGIISNPLSALLGGISEIRRKNYGQRIHFEKNDEFAEVANAFNDMAAELNEWENSNLSKIISEKLRIETIIEQMYDAIIGINEKQEILFINTAAKNILNLNEEKLQGRAIAGISQQNDLFKSIIDGQKNNKPYKIVVDGKDAYFQLETREILIPNLTKDTESPINVATKSAGKVYILRNITEFKELDEAKTNFIATVSHELKTPISAIKMSAALLEDNRVGGLNTEQGQLVKQIGNDAERLLNITSELLDLSQVETGNIQLNFVSAKPQQIVDYAIKAIQFEADQKGLNIQQSIPTDIADVQADVEKSAWVLINFLSNAVRYSPAKSRLLINVGQKKSMIEFSVQDFGKGIEEKYKERLFDRYFQVPTDGQNKSGTGLGLAISKEFIIAQGGDIGVESEVGVGSRFYFELPCFK